MCSDQNLYPTGEASSMLGELRRVRSGCGTGLRSVLEGSNRLHLEFFIQTYFLPVIGLVDAEKLKPGDLVVSGVPEPRQGFSSEVSPTG